MEAEQEREEILKKLRDIWFENGCYFSGEILDVMKQIKNKKDFEKCDFCKK